MYHLRVRVAAAPAFRLRNYERHASVRKIHTVLQVLMFLQTLALLTIQCGARTPTSAEKSVWRSVEPPVTSWLFTWYMTPPALHTFDQAWVHERLKMWYDVVTEHLRSIQIRYHRS